MCANMGSQTTIYYSTGTSKLTRVAGPSSINLAGGGQFQLGILKKPTGTSDVVNAGYQSPNLNEGQIYGGLFLEDSANGCVSL
jgi:pantothenate kinase